MGLFDDLSQTIWRDKHVLQEDYQPDEILERDEEIEEYIYALKGIIEPQDEPNDVMLYGKAGVGKTAVTRFVLDELQQTANDREGVDPVYVHWHNCNGETIFTALRTLLNEYLPDDADPFPERGLGYSNVRERFFETIDETGGNHIIVFDEIDHLTDANDLLYDITRARSNDDLVEADVLIIGISNNYQFRKQLSPKVKSSFQEDEIRFASYNPFELTTILQDRADRALTPDAYEEAALRLAAAIAAKDTGSARQAIDLLRKGGELAERDAEETPVITEEDIEHAREAVKRGRLTNKIGDQPTHTRLVLETVARLEDRQETPARSKEIMRRYRVVATDRGEEPLTTLEGMRNHLSDLVMLGFLDRTEKNEGRAGGRNHLYTLNMDAAVVFEVCDDLHARGE
jgi:cell division control protein 6